LYIRAEEMPASESRPARFAAEFDAARIAPRPIDWLRVALVSLALCYAFFAGLRTVADFDLGWQLATGRYILQHHLIPSTEVLSYTARGNSWLYPPFSGVIFYLLYLLGGYAALSCLSAAACVATVAWIVGQGTRTTAALAIVAVPAIAFRTVPRAEIFTTILFAGFAATVWNYYRGRKAHLFLLPAVMLAWVNLHTGFISGLALVGAWCFLEFCELPFGSRRAAALDRMRRAAPWMLVSLAVTLLNPWGWRIYEAISRQSAMTQLHTEFIGEWSPVRLSAFWFQAFSLRDPAGADWWLLLVAVLAIVAAIFRKEIGPAVVLAYAAYEALAHIRLQGLFAILVCIVAGSLLSREFHFYKRRRGFREESPAPSTRAPAPLPEAGSLHLSPSHFSRPLHRAGWFLLAFLALMVGIRVSDLVTDRYYLWSGQIALFGAGPSWWFPERATSFLLRENLPGNVFGDYNLGGYLAWRLGPRYPDYFDGRFIPFGTELFIRHRTLVDLPLDSPEWLREAGQRNIQTAIFSVARFGGLGNFPLQADCESKAWSPVFLDDVAVIFVRNSPENAPLLRRLAVSCSTAPIPVPSAPPSARFMRVSAGRFQSLMNAASIDFVLSRDTDAAANLASAQAIFPDDPNLHLLRAQLDQAHGQAPEAEREFLASLHLRQTDVAWYALAQLYAVQGRYSEAVHSLRQSAALSQMDYDRYRALGKLYLLMSEPQNALNAFAEASRKSSYRAANGPLDPEFSARVAEGSAIAYRKLGNLESAIAAQEQAVRLTPGASSRWLALAELYHAAGRSAQADEARNRSALLAVPERSNP
jgi:tetratricopeptide (TPR) repeat protein